MRRRSLRSSAPASTISSSRALQVQPARLVPIAARGAAVAAMLLVLGCAPASAAPRGPRCEAAPGPTLAANAQVRVFVAPEDPAGYSTAISACAPGSRKIKKLALGRRTAQLAQVAVNGPWAVATEARYSTLVGHGQGVSYTIATVVNVTTGRAASSGTLTGVEVTDTAIAPDGVVTLLARPFGNPRPVDPDAYPFTWPSTRGVFQFDPRTEATRHWATLDDVSKNAYAGLALTTGAVVWQRDGAVQSAPLAGSTVPARGDALTSSMLRPTLKPRSARVAARRSCDRRGGTTVAANSRLRLVRVDRPGGVQEYSACSYATRLVTGLGYWDPASMGNGSKPYFTWAINGEWVAISKSDPGSDDGTDRSAGISTEQLWIANARTRRVVQPGAPVNGLRFREMVVSPSGTVAAIGDPYRFGYLPDDAHGPLTTSQVVLYDPGSAPPPGYGSNVWRTVSTAPPGSLTGLAASGSTLVWSQAGEMQQRSFAAAGLPAFGAGT